MKREVKKSKGMVKNLPGVNQMSDDERSRIK
jgi:hypothetical protein